MRLYLNQVALKNVCMSRPVRPFYKSRFWPAIKVLYKVHFVIVVQHFETSSLFHSYCQVWTWCSCSQKSPTLLVLLYLKFVSKQQSVYLQLVDNARTCWSHVPIFPSDQWCMCHYQYPLCILRTNCTVVVALSI